MQLMIRGEPMSKHKSKLELMRSTEMLCDCIYGGHCEPLIRPAHKDPVHGFNMMATKRCTKCDMAFPLTDEEKKICDQ